jgi:pilus assembly protein CpaB
MRPRTLAFTALAIVACLGTGYMTQIWLSKERLAVTSQAKKPSPRMYVLVAAKILPTGTFVRTEDLTWQAWPDEGANTNYLYKDKDTMQSVVGSVVRQRISAGEPITTGRLVKPGDRGFLAAVLSPGMRAVSVPVTAISGVAGLVFPGDRVDLVLSHQVKDDREPNAPAKFATETVLSDIRVLAIDQTLTDQDNKPSLAKTVTFEVTPKQVEVIGVASGLGNLSLSLRSIALNGDDQPARKRYGSISHTWDSEVSSLIVHHDPEQASVLTVLRGSFGSGAGAPANGSRIPVAPSGVAAGLPAVGAGP